MKVIVMKVIVMKVIVMKTLSWLSNTLRNNYSKDKCENIITSGESRKLVVCLTTGLHYSWFIVGLLNIHFGWVY